MVECSVINECPDVIRFIDLWMESSLNSLDGPKLIIEFLKSESLSKCRERYDYRKGVRKMCIRRIAGIKMGGDRESWKEAVSSNLE